MAKKTSKKTASKKSPGKKAGKKGSKAVVSLKDAWLRGKERTDKGQVRVPEGTFVATLVEARTDVTKKNAWAHALLKFKLTDESAEDANGFHVREMYGLENDVSLSILQGALDVLGIDLDACDIQTTEDLDKVLERLEKEGPTCRVRITHDGDWDRCRVLPGEDDEMPAEEAASDDYGALSLVGQKATDPSDGETVTVVSQDGTKVVCETDGGDKFEYQAGDLVWAEEAADEAEEEEEEEEDEEEETEEEEEEAIEVGSKVSFDHNSKGLRTGVVREVLEDGKVKVKWDDNKKLSSVPVAECDLIDE